MFDAPVIEEELHARLGPSNHRWPECPGSVREEAPYEDVAGAAAIDGTGTHLLLELCLINGVRAETYEGQIIGVNHHDAPSGWIIHRDRIDRVQECLDYVERRVNELKVEYSACEVTVTAEEKSNPGEFYGRDDWWGTCDITIRVIDPTGSIFVDPCIVYIETVDYKDGRGYVTAENNSQLESYLIGRVIDTLYAGPNGNTPGMMTSCLSTLKGCRMTIVQPKTNPSVRYQDSDFASIARRADELAAAAHATDDPDAPLKYGKHCKWCKANPKRGGHCSAESSNSMKVVNEMTNLIATDGDLLAQVSSSIEQIDKLSEEQLTQLMDVKTSLMTIFDKVEGEIQKRIDTGIKVPGYAMKPGRASKSWNVDEAEVEKFLKGRRVKKADIYPAKLISPAAALKLDLTAKQKEDLMQLISETSNTLKLTRVSRGEETTAEDMFKDVLEESVAQTDNNVIQSAPSVFEEQSPVTAPEVESSDEDKPVSFF